MPKVQASRLLLWAYVVGVLASLGTWMAFFIGKRGGSPTLVLMEREARLELLGFLLPLGHILVLVALMLSNAFGHVTIARLTRRVALVTGSATIGWCVWLATSMLTLGGMRTQWVNGSCLCIMAALLLASIFALEAGLARVNQRSAGRTPAGRYDTHSPWLAAQAG